MAKNYSLIDGSSLGNSSSRKRLGNLTVKGEITFDFKALVLDGVKNEEKESSQTVWQRYTTVYLREGVSV